MNVASIARPAIALFWWQKIWHSSKTSSQNLSRFLHNQGQFRKTPSILNWPKGLVSSLHSDFCRHSARPVMAVAWYTYSFVHSLIFFFFFLIPDIPSFISAKLLWQLMSSSRHGFQSQGAEIVCCQGNCSFLQILVSVPSAALAGFLW